MICWLIPGLQSPGILQKFSRGRWLIFTVKSNCPLAFTSWTICPLKLWMIKIDISEKQRLRSPPGWRQWTPGCRQIACDPCLPNMDSVSLTQPLYLLHLTFPVIPHIKNECYYIYKVVLNMKKDLTLEQDSCPGQQILLLFTCRRQFATLNPWGHRVLRSTCVLYSSPWGPLLWHLISPSEQLPKSLSMSAAILSILRLRKTCPGDLT